MSDSTRQLFEDLYGKKWEDIRSVDIGPGEEID